VRPQTNAEAEAEADPSLQEHDAEQHTLLPNGHCAIVQGPKGFYLSAEGVAPAPDLHSYTVAFNVNGTGMITMAASSGSEAIKQVVYVQQTE
jgi:hypothetical protein